jgi:hypothetical protein
MARSAGLSCAWVATWADDLTWLGAVTRPTKKDRRESAMTVSAMTALRLEWVEGWSVLTWPRTVVVLMMFPFSLDHPGGDRLEFKVLVRSKGGHRETSSDEP